MGRYKRDGIALLKMRGKIVLPDKVRQYADFLKLERCSLSVPWLSTSKNNVTPYHARTRLFLHVGVYALR